MNESWLKYAPEILREWLDGRHQVQKTIGNTGWLLFDRVIRLAIGITVGAWVARYLGPSRFGDLAYVISFIAFFHAIARLDADGFVVRDIAQARADSGVILGSALWVRLCTGTFSWLAAVGSMALLHPSDHQLILLTAIVGGTLAFQASETVDLWFQSQSQSRRTVRARLATYLVSNGCKVALILAGAPLVAFAAVLFLEAAVQAVSLLVAYRRFPTGNRWKATVAQVKTLLHQCWPFIVCGVMIATYSRIDQIMLKEMLGEQKLGLYAAALQISLAWNLIPTTIVTSLAPVFARKKAHDEGQYQEALVHVFRFFALAGLLVSALTALAAPWIIKILYGPEYETSALILQMHVFVNLILFQGDAQALWITNNNVRGVVMLATFMAAVLGVVCNAFLISKFGVLGAPISIYIAEFVAVFAIPCFFHRDLLTLYKRAFFFAPAVAAGRES